MNIKLTADCKEWILSNLTDGGYAELRSKIGLRASIASNPRAHGRNAGKNLNRKIRAEFGIPPGIAIFECAPNNPRGEG